MSNKTSLFDHEQQAIDEITKILHSKGHYRVLSNLYLYDPQSNYYYEYDLIIISQSNIFVVELKHWSGHVKIAEYNWVVNGHSYRRDPHSGNMYKCKVLKGLYQQSFRTYPNVWVESVVVLTHPDALVENADSPKDAADTGKKNPSFASISDFLSYANRRSSKSSNKILEKEHVNNVAKYLSSIDKPRPSTIDYLLGYEIVERLATAPGRLELVGRHASGRLKGLKRFRLFRAPVGCTPEEETRFLKIAYNTIESVSQIGDHPHILKVDLMEDEISDVIEVSDWSDTGTLRDLFNSPNNTPNKEESLKICEGILSALLKAHDNNIIHRAVKPENILLINGIPKLMNFDLAYISEDNRITVIENPDSLKDDGYIAPELIFGEDIDEGTDFFCLAVIAYELFTRERPFVSVREFVAQGGKLSDKSITKLRDSGISPKLLDVILSMLNCERDQRLTDVSIITEAFTAAEPPDIKKPVKEVNAILPSGSTHDVFLIEDLIGQGGEAQVYKARTTGNAVVAIKLYNSEIPVERTVHEKGIIDQINSSYVVRSERHGFWGDRFYLVLDYIEGRSMRELIDSGNRPDIDEFKTIAHCLMEAITAFHQNIDENGIPNTLLHCDIKPDNVMITKDQKAVLIDCTLSGQPRTDIYQGTRDYIAPDCILGTDVQFSESNDLYALGITLWEWLCGESPYEKATIRSTPIHSDGLDILPENLMNWLRKSVATQAENRFLNIDEMKKEFTDDPLVEEEFFVEKEKNLHEVDLLELEIVDVADSMGVKLVESRQDDYVDYLNTLSNNSSGNENATAEHQVLNDYFSRIYVKNPITDDIYRVLKEEKKNVILTGNAGDGKTTIALDIFEKIVGEKRFLSPIETIEEANLVIIKDMSELSSSDQIKVLKNISSDTSMVYLIVTNTGTLLSSFRNAFTEQAVESVLLNALKANSPRYILDDKFFVVNLGSVDSIKTACDVLRRMVKKENWVQCTDCASTGLCPLYVNVQLVLKREDLFFDRLELLYRRLFEYGTRLTMRHMTGHLAYALTGGLSCEEIRSRSEINLRGNLHKDLFFNRFFGDDGQKPLEDARQLYPIRKIRDIGLGSFLDSSFERHIWLVDQDSGAGDDIHTAVTNVITKENNVINRRQTRRYAYFFQQFEVTEREEKFISSFLRSDLILQYVRFCSKVKNLPAREENVYRRQIIQVLQEFFTGLRFPEGTYRENFIYITLNHKLSSSGSQMILADFRLDDFKLVVKPKYQIGKSLNAMLCLQYRSGAAELELDLPFLDYVTRRYKGEVAEELSAFYADRLERFKVQLLTLNEADRDVEGKTRLRLLVVGRGRKMDVKDLLIENGQVEVI